MKRKFFGKNIKGRVAAARDLSRNRPGRKPVPVFTLLLAGALWLAVMALFYSGRLMRPQDISLGQRAGQTVVAAVDFECENLSATALKKQVAAETILPAFSIDLSTLNEARQVLSKLIPRLRALQSAESPEQKPLAQASLNDALDLLAIPLTPEQLMTIVPADRQTDLNALIFTAVSNAAAQGVIADPGRPNPLAEAAPAGKLIVRGIEPADTIRTMDSFAAESDARQSATAAILRSLPRENRDESAIRTLIKPWLKPNLVYESAETARRRTQAVAVTVPVIETIPAGTVLLHAGETANEQILKRLEAHEQRLSRLETPAERIQRLAGSGLLLLGGLILAAAILGIVRPEMLERRRDLVLMALVSLLPITLGKLLLYSAVNLQLFPSSAIRFAMPLSLAPLLMSVLAGSVPALVTGFWVSFALAVMLSNSFEVFLLGLLVTALAVYAAKNAKHRITLFRAGLLIGGLNILFVLILAILNRPDWRVLLPQVGAALVSGIACALLATVLIPVFEHLFRVTTDITLLELSDLTHPLLQSLAIHAPGTYHHSLMVASLAQHAAEAIGADGLLLRVCAYFHDVGKLVKPEYFSENIPYKENPHDDLSPSMSTLVIVSHIKEGVTLAKKYRLPGVILDAIQQHQGTSLVSVFYHRARKQQEEAGEARSAVRDSDFRYEGPLPRTKEMAILMLADSCEAASRSLEKPTAQRIAGMINDIFTARINDGQLDECNLTLAELNAIRQSFVFSLTGMLHPRVAYPKEDAAAGAPAADPRPDSGRSGTNNKAGSE